MKRLPVGDIAPDWKLDNAGGKVHSLAQYRGKVIVMDFWATWCGPCAKIMPRLQKLHEKLADKGVVVLGVNSWENSDPVKLMQKKRYSYELLLNGEQIAEAYKVTTLPVVYIIGLDGTIIYCHEGEGQKDLSAVIEKYFKANGIAKGFRLQLTLSMREGLYLPCSKVSPNHRFTSLTSHVFRKRRVV